MTDEPGPPTTSNTPPRRLRAVGQDEPPFDPDYDQPTNNHAPRADRAAEQAILGLLLTHPDRGTTLTNHLNPNDFYWPHHGQLWDTWHHLAHQQGHPPDPITLNAHLLTTGQHDLARTLPELLSACPNPTHGPHYAQIVRDNARLRAYADAGRKLTQTATTGALADVEQLVGDSLQTLDDVARRYGPTDPAAANRTGLADLTWLLNGNRPTATPPRWCTRRDGTALFYEGRHNGVFGDPESGKTWLAQCAGVEALQAGHTFAMIDVDHNGQEHTAARLALLGAPWDVIADPNRFRYYEPEDGTELLAAVHDITQLAPTVVVIDSLGEILPMLGVKSVDNDEITAALRTVVMPPAKAGSCVISVDHLPKSAEARSTGFAIGGTAKKRAVDGAYLRADAKIKPAPGQTGRVMLRIEKDRTGELRKTSPGGYAGTFTLDSTAFDGQAPDGQEGAPRWSIGRDELPRNDDGTPRPTRLMERVATYIADNDQCTQNDVLNDVPGKSTHLRDAIKTLVTEGFIARAPGPNRTQHHTTLIPYREAEDDHAQR